MIDKFLSRREGHLRTPRPLRDRGLAKASTTPPASRSSPSWPRRSSATRTATCSFPAPARWPTCCARRSRRKLGIKRVRGDTFGYLQRWFLGCVSDVDQREAREVGEKAVQYAMWGDRDGSVAIKRTGFYSVTTSWLPLEAVAGKTRAMEDEFIAASGTDVTDAFRLYLRPLLGSGHAGRLPPASQQGGEGFEQDLMVAIAGAIALWAA